MLVYHYDVLPRDTVNLAIKGVNMMIISLKLIHRENLPVKLKFKPEAHFQHISLYILSALQLVSHKFLLILLSHILAHTFLLVGFCW